MKKIDWQILAIIGTLVMIWLAVIIGWFANIHWLFTAVVETNAQFWLSLAGLFIVPVGVINGWVHMIF